jgi:hypothetical protein
MTFEPTFTKDRLCKYDDESLKEMFTFLMNIVLQKYFVCPE